MKTLIVTAAIVVTAALGALAPPAAELLTPPQPELMALPQATWPSQQFLHELKAANAQVRAELATLAGAVAEPTPCTQPTLAGPPPGQGPLTLRPGQEVLLRGCFARARGEVRALGRFPARRIDLSVLGWTTEYVHARMPDIAGAFDQDDVRLQVRQVGAAGAAEADVQFRARRVSHEVYGPALAQYVRSPAGATRWFAPVRPQQHVVGLVAAPGSATAGVRVQAHASDGTLEITPTGALGIGVPPIIGVVLDLPVGTDAGLGMPSLKFVPGYPRSAVVTTTAAG